MDTAFDGVIEACADPHRPHGWISQDIRFAYRRLHDMGWVHSVEAWGDDGELAGGLYGVAIGGLFAGESMFHRRSDASKAALVGLVELLRASDHAGRLLDVQWMTPHLASLGCGATHLGRLPGSSTFSADAAGPTAVGAGALGCDRPVPRGTMDHEQVTRPTRTARG